MSTDAPQPVTRATSGPVQKGLVEIRTNGSKFQVPLQGGILVGVLTIAVQFFGWFSAMNDDVQDAKSSLQKVADSIGSLESTLGDAAKQAKENSQRLEKATSDSAATSERVKELEAQVRKLETCARNPRHKPCDI